MGEDARNRIVPRPTKWMATPEAVKPQQDTAERAVPLDGFGHVVAA